MISEVGVTYQKPWTCWQMIFYICSHTIRAIKCHFDANKASLLALLDGVVEENGIVGPKKQDTQYTDIHLCVSNQIFKLKRWCR